MSTALPPQVYTDLQFYLWRIRKQSEAQWRPEVCVMGSDAAFSTILDALASMEVEFRKEGSSTRKFLCNPPEDVDVVRIANEHKVEMEWLIWLILSMEQDVDNDATRIIKNKAVTVRLTQQTLQKLRRVLENRVTQQKQEAQKAPGGLYFVSDWLEGV
jgi:hypothetical protein